MLSESNLRSLTCENKSFSKTIPGLQVAWDSTSLGLLKTCPRKYYIAIIEGWEPKAKAIALDFGIWYHQGMENYHKARALGQPHDEALRTVVRSLLEATYITDPETGERAPWVSHDTKRSRFTLLRAVVWHLEEFGKDDPATTVIRTDGTPMAEFSFRFATEHFDPEGNPYLLCGHFDRVVEFGNRIFVCDYKTTGSTISSRYFDSFTPDNQMTLYTFAGSVVMNSTVAGVMIDAAQLAVTFNRFGRGFAPRTESQIQEWYSDLRHWFNLAEGCAERKSWPMNDTAGACGMYGGCTFRGICSKDPSVRHVFLEGDFQRRTWDPLTPRN